VISRSEVHYHTLWVRLLCCAAVAIGMANAVYFELFLPVERLLHFVMIPDAAGQHVHAGKVTEVLLVVAVCLAAAVPRIDRPLPMVLCGAGFVLTYVTASLLVLAVSGVLPPLVNPVIGLIGCTAVLETMAWNEEYLRRRKAEELGEVRQEFTDMLAHDLRKRISAILMSISVLEKRTEGKDVDIGDVMSTIRASAERLMLLIDNLLDVRRIEEGGISLQREVVTAADLLNEAVNEHRNAAEMADLRLILVNPDPFARIRVDRQVFVRVLTNLIWNAIQHATPQTDIEVSCRMFNESVVLIDIANQGKAIPLNRQHTVFLPFVAGRSKRGGLSGTGLGLAFCMLAVTSHNGTIDVESPWYKHGNGAKFTIRLPAVR